MPGLYNEKALVEITVDPVQDYDFMYLSTFERTRALTQHFARLKERLEQEMGVPAFDEFGLPVHDEVQKIVGRVINTSTEDDKLTLESVGLFNVGDDSGSRTYKLRLNLGQCGSCSLFEGEVIVAEGFNDSQNRFNVCKVHKPVLTPPPKVEWSLIKRAQEN